MKPHLLYMFLLFFVTTGCFGKEAGNNESSDENVPISRDTVTFSRDYFMPDSIGGLHFKLTISQVPDEPIWIKQFLNQYIHSELTNVYFDYNQKPELLSVSQSTSWEQIGEYYYTWLKDGYIKEFSQYSEDVNFNGEDYSFEITVYPVWENEKYITYQIYADELPGSMRNRERDFCRTFDKATGRELGIADFYTDSEFEDVENWIGKQLDSKLDKEGLTASVNSELVDASSDMNLKEIYRGNIYPRPAITSEGIIFTYQTYEIGSAADGIVKITVPYSKSL